MTTVVERMGLDSECLWELGVVAILVVPVDGSLASPRVVYDGFVWRYFWGPAQANVSSAICATRAGGITQYLDTASACTAAAEPVTHPGYAFVSEVGRTVTLVIALSGVVSLLHHLDIGERPRFFYALFPLILFGGAFRVAEDASDAPDVADVLITCPLSTLIINPVTYVTVFAVMLVAAVESVPAKRRDLIDDYVKPLFGTDLVVFTVTLGYLLRVGLAGTQGVTFYPWVLVVILAGATLTAVTTWWPVERFAPEVSEGTGYVGPVVIWGHATDGVANVIDPDWMTDPGVEYDLVPKHPVNQAVVNFISSTPPESVLAVTGGTWPFLLVKLVAATAVVWVFDGQTFEDSPRYAILLLIAILAVGLGPGSRDMLCTTFGI